MKTAQFSLLLLLGLFIIACSKDDDDSTTERPDGPPGQAETPTLPETLFNYANIDLPAHYTNNAFPPQNQFQRTAEELDNTPDDNPVTDAGSTLGRVLFYDRKLSANGTISCASCHRQNHGFSDPAVLSRGFDGEHTGRHSMGLANARYYLSGKFFWDERAETLEDQVLMPFQDPVEMGLTLDELENIVQSQDYYPALFNAAFGSETMTSEEISKALAQFIRSMVSTTSKYDNARVAAANPMEDFAGFTDQENEGKRLFFQPIETTSGDLMTCASCHISEAFVGSVPPGAVGTTTSTNNGLDETSTDDLGVFDTTNNNNDIGKFKAPSLKNIGIRPPYMHDGRFATLEEVIEHYNSGIQNHMNLAPQLRGSDGNPVQLDLSQAEKDALVAFLHTLTDEEMLADEKFSNPF